MVGIAVTVCLCTLDRAEGASTVFRSLLRQRVESNRVELLLVDNGSSAHDAVALGETLTAEARAAGFAARHVVESERGLAIARNRALREANGEWLAFVDDDETADEGWLAALLAEIDAAESSPPLGCIGGPMLLSWPDAPPSWYAAPLGGYLSEIDLGGEPRDLDPRRTALFGGNFCVARQTALDLGGFSARLGRSGHEQLMGNEERMMQITFARAGYRVRYVPAAVIHHHVMPDRHDAAWMRRRAHDQGLSDARLGTLLNRRGRTRRLVSASRDWWRRTRNTRRERAAGRWSAEQATLISAVDRARYLGTVRGIVSSDLPA